MTEFEALALEEIKGIRAAIEALVLLNAPDEAQPVECEHVWIDLGGERECRTCHKRN